MVSVPSRTPRGHHGVSQSIFCAAASGCSSRSRKADIVKPCDDKATRRVYATSLSNCYRA